MCGCLKVGTSERPQAALPLAITCGDPAGVGPEVIAAALRNDALGGKDCVLVGPAAWAEPLAAELGLGCELVGDIDFTMEPGCPSLAGAGVALEALDVAARGCVESRFRGVVSGPVSKHWLQQVGFKHPGQTEFFAAAWGGEPTMAFISALPICPLKSCLWITTLRAFWPINAPPMRY